MGARSGGSESLLGSATTISAGGCTRPSTPTLIELVMLHTWMLDLVCRLVCQLSRTGED
jgi:hypothetical protein